MRAVKIFFTMLKDKRVLLLRLSREGGIFMLGLVFYSVNFRLVNEAFLTETI